MTKVRAHLHVTRRFLVAGPNPSLEEPLVQEANSCTNGPFAAASWRARHGLEGGRTNADSDEKIVEESLRRTGSVVMGRRDVQAAVKDRGNLIPGGGLVGRRPPVHVPVFVLNASRSRDPGDGGRNVLHLRQRRASRRHSSRRARPAQGERPSCSPAAPASSSQYLKAGLAGTNYRFMSPPSSWAMDVPLRPTRNRAPWTRSDESDRVAGRHPPALHGAWSSGLDQPG